MKSSLLFMIIGVVVVAGGAYFLLSGNGALNGGDQMTEENTTFAALAASNKDLECTFEYNDGKGNISSGTVYLTKGAKSIRGDFNIEQSAGGPMDVHLVRDNGYNYIWGSFYSQGIKTEVTAEDEGKLYETKEGPGIAEDTVYTCKSWNVDQSKFSMPSGVEFMDLSASMDASMDASGSMGGMKAMQCAACDQAPTESARAQCRAALSC